MANSLRDQLLKAGLVTQKQVEEANQPKPKPTRPASNKDAKPPPREGKRPSSTAPMPSSAPPKPPITPKKPKEPEDLAKFYKARDQLERNEREEEERLQREIAARRKQTREEVRTLITSHLQNVAEAEIRYNFVVGENIKYLYVTEQQQQQLAAGELAVTFLEGKRCLIPVAIAQQILALDPSKIVVINQPESEAPTSP